MASIDKNQVEKIAHNVRIAISEDEAEKYTNQIQTLLEKVDRLAELNTDEVHPTTHGIILGNVLREDKPIQSLNQEKALKNAPDQEDGHFKVPSIME